jgi:hypothetical protein
MQTDEDTLAIEDDDMLATYVGNSRLQRQSLMF